VFCAAAALQPRVPDTLRILAGAATGLAASAGSGPSCEGLVVAAGERTVSRHECVMFGPKPTDATHLLPRKA
jgi:hypothetical protein